MCERASTWEISFYAHLQFFSAVMTCENEICERAKWASSSGIVIFFEFDSIALYFIQISLNYLKFWIISFSFLKFPWYSLNFWNSMRRSKFLRFRQKKEVSLKVEALIQQFIPHSISKCWLLLENFSSADPKLEIYLQAVWHIIQILQRMADRAMLWHFA